MARALATASAAVPTLDELAAEPARANTLPRAAVQALLHRCIAAQTVLLGALAASEPGKADSEPDRLLDVDEAAQRLGCSADWLYRHARQLPFAVRARLHGAQRPQDTRDLRPLQHRR